MKRARQNGLSLIELMVTVSIAAVLIAIAVPSFHKQVQSSAQKSVTTEFIVAMAYARAESVKRGTEVHLHSTSGTTNWGQGWCVTTSNNCSGEKIRQFDIADGQSITSNVSGLKTFSFNSQGFLVGSSRTISFCNDVQDKKITVTPLGQALMQNCNCNNNGICN